MENAERLDQEEILRALRENIEELKKQYYGKARLRFDEVRQILGGVSKDFIYDLLVEGRLLAHNPSGKPGTRGTMILSFSVWAHLEKGLISPERWLEPIRPRTKSK